jgi:hypothetical protein
MSVLTVLGSKEQSIQMTLPASRNVFDLDHRLGRLNQTKDAERIGAACLLVRRADRLDTRYDPLYHIGIVGFGEGNGFDVARAELRVSWKVKGRRAQNLPWHPDHLRPKAFPMR